MCEWIYYVRCLSKFYSSPIWRRFTKKWLRKIPILTKYSKQSWKFFFLIFSCFLKVLKIRVFNYMTNSNSEGTLPECCRAHRRWGKPAPEREHALRIITSNKTTSAETLFKFYWIATLCSLWHCKLNQWDNDRRDLTNQHTVQHSICCSRHCEESLAVSNEPFHTPGYRYNAGLMLKFSLH